MLVMSLAYTIHCFMLWIDSQKGGFKTTFVVKPPYRHQSEFFLGNRCVNLKLNFEGLRTTTFP